MKKVFSFVFSFLFALSIFSQSLSLNQVKAIWRPRFMPSVVNLDSTWSAFWNKTSDGIPSILSLTSPMIPYANTSSTLANSYLGLTSNYIFLQSGKSITSEDTGKVRLDFGTTGNEVFNVTTDNNAYTDPYIYLKNDTSNGNDDVEISADGGYTGSFFTRQGSSTYATVRSHTTLSLDAPLSYFSGTATATKIGIGLGVNAPLYPLVLRDSTAIRAVFGTFVNPSYIPASAYVFTLPPSGELSIFKDSPSNVNMKLIGISHTSGAGSAINMYGAASTVVDVKIAAGSSANSYFNAGQVGFGVTSPTAVIDLKAGTSGANTAPIHIANGTKETVARTGCIELGGNWYLTKNNNVRTAVPGIIATSTTDAPNSGTGETVLYSYTIAANTLETNGDNINYKVVFSDVAGSGGDLSKIGFDGTILESTDLTGLTGSISYDVTIWRVNSTNYKWSINVVSGLGVAASLYGSGTTNFTTATVLQALGESPLGGSSNVIARAATLRFDPKN